MTDPDDRLTSIPLDTGVSRGLCLAIEPLLAALDRLAGALHNKGRELDIILTAAARHPQDVASMTLGREFDAFAASVSEDRVALRHLQQRVVAAHPEIFVELCRTLTQTAVKVSKICRDLQLLAAVPQAGLADITLPARQARVAATECDALVFAEHDAMATIAADVQQASINPLEPVMMRALLESLQWMTRAIVTLRVHCIEGIAANATRVDAFLSSNRLTRQ